MCLQDYPFRFDRWPKGIAYPQDHDGGDSLMISIDLGAVEESTKKKIIHEWCAFLPGQAGLKRLSLWSHVNQPLFEAACQLDGLEVLQIKWSNITKLDSIRKLKNLQALSIGSSTKIQSIEPLADLISLHLLEIENFKKIVDFFPFTRLKNLEYLSVTGSMWTRQNVGSMEPFAEMTWLKSLAIDTTHVKSIRPLARLTQLENLDIGGRLPFEEYAWLSAKLPNTDCRWFSPYLELSESGYSPCKTCGQKAMVMLTGRGKPVICKFCEADKLNKHVAVFNAARQNAGKEPGV
ncbi:leucine-rich repeat domain-containing protein [Methylomonas rhizoryzae]|uniref:leucine-rich repeat domain-containing protein n=1 Tax=Methylomonas rhizoryzae TaxID=2608981 RepID=UPI001232AD68|nr:leucine-rich repeat domain-containing protein [Methylomonas rhizoryzae]